MSEKQPSSQTRSEHRAGGECRIGWATIVSLVSVDLILSVLAFVLAYKFRHDADLFVWKRKSFLPVRVADEFLPYLSLLLFVPAVKGLALRRYGLFKLRGEFSFSDDFIRVLKASTMSFLVLVLSHFSPAGLVPRRPDNQPRLFLLARSSFRRILSAILFWLRCA